MVRLQTRLFAMCSCAFWMKSAMATSLRKKRLSPPLMFAFRAAHAEKDARKEMDLRDAAGERVIAARRGAARSAITEMGLRREVMRDIDALMNTIALESVENLDEYEQVRKSVLNFGCPDIANRTIDEARLMEIRSEIETALRRHEPRLIRDTIEVIRDDSVDKVELRVRFTIRADLSCNPVNIPVEFFADVECDTGKIVMTRL